MSISSTEGIFPLLLPCHREGRQSHSPLRCKSFFVLLLHKHILVVFVRLCRVHSFKHLYIFVSAGVLVLFSVLEQYIPPILVRPRGKPLQEDEKHGWKIRMTAVFVVSSV